MNVKIVTHKINIGLKVARFSDSQLLTCSITSICNAVNKLI